MSWPFKVYKKPNRKNFVVSMPAKKCTASDAVNTNNQANVSTGHLNLGLRTTPTSDKGSSF